MTSVVIDPSVYVSALIGQPGSAPDLVIRAAIDDKLAVIVCPLLIRELESVLARPKFRRYVTSAQAKEYVARIRRHAIHVDDPPEASGLTRDPADDYLVSLGRQGNVDAIISLDLDLLEAGLADPPAWTHGNWSRCFRRGNAGTEKARDTRAGSDARQHAARKMLIVGSHPRGRRTRERVSIISAR